MERTHLRLRRLVKDECLALAVDPVDQSVLVAAGIDLPVRPDCHAQDVLLLRRVEDGCLALRGQAIDASLRPGAGVKILSLRIDGQ